MARYVISTGDGKHKLGKATNYQSAKGIARNLSVEYFVVLVWNFDTHAMVARFESGKEIAG